MTEITIEHALTAGGLDAFRTVGDLKQRAATLLAEIRQGAEKRERERILPHEQIRRLGSERLLTWRIPRSQGGPGATVRETVQFVIDVAAADSNIAQALRPSFLFIESLLAAGDESLLKRWLPRYLRGDVFGNAGWEIGGANGAVSATIVRDGDHYRASGSKYYSTGSLYADWISAVALDDGGREIRFMLPRERPGLELVDDFDAMGQRLTASGTTNLVDVLVREEDIVPAPANPSGTASRSIVPPFAQLFLAAVEAGVARNALEDAVHFARHHARPIKHSSASRSVDDPYVRFSVGQISALAYAAEAVVLRAADSIDAAWSAGLEDDSIVRASIDVAQAQFIAAESALRASELIFDVGGASTTARKHNLDRHWRNARTVANHNPRHWKAAVVGAWHLDGITPPTSGLF
ncbi:acyl-CoA dehydrogenase family protein [Azohydromonas aeria]|uniref:acyl-CoA dehydrogenase family protein n=1 Tax=Azohydromonas aeria TaxID=2590212 RepID=UPI0012F98D36|nr:acyl-CoA dehydrogenase family protein [Azohydromonas aeria]